MAGHSKFKNIMHRKGAQDAKRAKKFARLTKELQVAVRGGTDPSSNPRLRSALAACRSVNMPKDNIERVIKKAETGQSSNLEEIRYEGYASGGIALIVDAVTDNRNRTAAEVRSSFTKYGGTLGETGSVSFMFNNIGQIIYNKNIKNLNLIDNNDHGNNSIFLRIIKHGKTLNLLPTYGYNSLFSNYFNYEKIEENSERVRKNKEEQNAAMDKMRNHTREKFEERKLCE